MKNFLLKTTLICTLISLMLVNGSVSAASKMQLTAPGGGEYDAKLDVLKYRQSNQTQVEAQWGTKTIYADYIEYSSNKATMLAQGNVTVLNHESDSKITCEEMLFEMGKDFFEARRNVIFEWGDKGRAFGDILQMNQQTDFLTMYGNFYIEVNEWKVVGEKLLGQPQAKQYNIPGPVNGNSPTMSFTAGNLKIDDLNGFMYLLDEVVVNEGENRLTAKAIEYNLNTKEIKTTR